MGIKPNHAIVKNKNGEITVEPCDVFIYNFFLYFFTKKIILINKSLNKFI